MNDAPFPQDQSDAYSIPLDKIDVAQAPKSWQLDELDEPPVGRRARTAHTGRLVLLAKS